MSLYPPSLYDIEGSGEALMAHKIYDRARVEMTRI